MEHYDSYKVPYSYVSYNKNPFGISKRINITNDEGLRIVVGNLLPLVVSKKRQLEIISNYLLLKGALQKRGEHIVDHLDEFDGLRHQLHKLAVKGPRQLKPWPINKSLK